MKAAVVPAIAVINTEFPAFGLGLFNRALAAGYGEEEAGALIKVLRGHTATSE
jgi:hypothetical protein